MDDSSAEKPPGEGEAGARSGPFAELGEGVAPRAVPRLVIPAALIAIVFHLVFLKLVGHFLPRADYGAIVAGTFLLYAVAYPTFAILGVGAALALSTRRDGEPPISPLAAFDRLTIRIVLAALAIAFVMTLIPVEKVLKLPNQSFAAVMPLLASAVVLEAAAVGALLGAGCERSFASALVCSPALRMAIAFTAFSYGVGSFAPLIAILLASTLTAAIARARLARSIAAFAPSPISAHREQSPFAALYSIPAMGALLAFGLFVHADIVLVRIRLSADDAAGYSALAAIGRIGQLLTLPIAFNLFIRTRRALAQRRSTAGQLARAVIATALLHGVILALVSVRPDVPFTLFVDSTIYRDVVNELPHYAIACAVYSLAQIVLFYGLAFDRVWLYLLPLGYLPLAINLVLRNADGVDNCVTAAQAQSILFASSLAILVGAFTLFLPWWLRRIGIAKR